MTFPNIAVRLWAGRSKTGDSHGLRLRHEMVTTFTTGMLPVWEPLPWPAMTPRTRVVAIVAAAAVLAVTGTVTITWLQTRGEPRRAPGAGAKRRPGRPPLVFDLGVRNDSESRALGR